MEKVDTIIFDLDGTLIDSVTDIIAAGNFTLRELGLREKNPEQIASYVGHGRDSLVRGLIGRRHIGKLSKAVSLFRGYYSDHCLDNAVLYPGVSATLHHFSSKTLVIVSNRIYNSVIKMLVGVGIKNYFSKIIGGDDADCLKPSACPIDKVLAELNGSRKTAIMVGDTDVDVIAGKNAGILTCAVTYGIGSKEKLKKTKPNYFIDNIVKLQKIII